MNEFLSNYGSKIVKVFTKGQKQEVKKVDTKVESYVPVKNFSYEQLPKYSKNLLRVAGISGALAVALAAYGSHRFKKHEQNPELRDLFNTAQYYHMVHSIALLSLPLVKKPFVTGSLWFTGLALFCGPMYYHAFTRDPSLRSITPFGGFCLIAGWLSIALL